MTGGRSRGRSAGAPAAPSLQISDDHILLFYFRILILRWSAVLSIKNVALSFLSHAVELFFFHLSGGSCGLCMFKNEM